MKPFKLTLMAGAAAMLFYASLPAVAQPAAGTPPAAPGTETPPTAGAADPAAPAAVVSVKHQRKRHHHRKVAAPDAGTDGAPATPAPAVPAQ